MAHLNRNRTLVESYANKCPALLSFIQLGCGMCGAILTAAKQTYERYGEQVGWKAFTGAPMPKWDTLAPNQREGYEASLRPLTSGLTAILRLVKFQRLHSNQITDYKTAYESLVEQIWAVGQPLIDTEQIESEMADDVPYISGGHD